GRVRGSAEVCIEVLASDGMTIYCATAVNLSMRYGHVAVTVPAERPNGTSRIEQLEPIAAGALEPAAVAYAIDGADDRAVAAAARLMQRGVMVRVADEAVELGGLKLARGSVLVTRLDNRLLDRDLAAEVGAVAAELGVRADAVATGWGEGDLADLGGAHFVHLTEPKIALLSRGSFFPGDVGSIWYQLDHHLGIRSSRLDANFLSG